LTRNIRVLVSHVGQFLGVIFEVVKLRLIRPGSGVEVFAEFRRRCFKFPDLGITPFTVVHRPNLAGGLNHVVVYAPGCVVAEVRSRETGPAI
jgi:hypothetical protein